MKIRLSIHGQEALATLHDTPTARDFAALLPLTLTVTDYAATEKVSDLPRRLTRDGAPPGYAASAGDLTYYAPWGNLAIFTRDFQHAAGLIPLGRIDAGREILDPPGALSATLARVDG
ncbi:MAG: cyclophilin-like fold protein [Planctomycetota bacterium]